VLHLGNIKKEEKKGISERLLKREFNKEDSTRHVVLYRRNIKKKKAEF